MCLVCILFHIEYGDFTLACILYFSPILLSCSFIGAVNSSKRVSRSACVASSFFCIWAYASGCSYLKLRSSSSVLILFRPSLLANGAYIYSVSPAILYCLLGNMEPSVRILCRRSEIFIRITLISSFIVRSSFLKFSACAEALSPKIPPDIFVSPSTIRAIFSPNRF